MNVSTKTLFGFLMLCIAFEACQSNSIPWDEMYFSPPQVNIEGYWIQVKTEFTNPDGKTYRSDYKVGNYWKMTEDSIFEMVYPDYIVYSTSYRNAFEYGIRCTNPTYNNIQNASFRGDTLVLGGNNERLIEHEYFLVKADIDKDSIDQLVLNRVNWSKFFGEWKYVGASDDYGEIPAQRLLFNPPRFVFINENSIFSYDTLKYYSSETAKNYQFVFSDPSLIHNTNRQILFHYFSEEDSNFIKLQYILADPLPSEND